MPYSHQDKQSGQLIRAADWNEMSREVEALGRAKLNRAGGDTIQGVLRVTGTTDEPRKPLLIVSHDNNTQSLTLGYGGLTASGSNANQPLAIAARGTGVLTLNADTAGNVGIGTPNPVNRLQISGNLHLDGGSIFLREGPSDQFNLLKWNRTTDRVELGGLQGVTLGHTKGTAGAVNAVLQIKQDAQVELLGSLSVRDALTLNTTATINQKTNALGLKVNAATDGPKTAIAEFRYDNQSQGVGIGYAAIFATGSNANQELAITARGTGVLTLNAESAGNVGIGVTNPVNKLQLKGNLHLDGGSLFLRSGPTDQYDVVKWNSSTDRVDVGGFAGTSLGYTNGSPNAVTPVLTVTQDRWIEMLGRAVVKTGTELLQLQRPADNTTGGKVVFLELYQADPKKQIPEVYPSIRFNHGNRYSKRIEGRSDGFHFKDGDLSNDSYVPIAASTYRFGDGTVQTSAVRIEAGVLLFSFPGSIKKTTMTANYSGFSAPPNVIANLVGIDADRGYNLRIRVSVENVTTTSCKVSVECWDNTILYSINLSWIAIGY